jgi:hypothetical protein
VRKKEPSSRPLRTRKDLRIKSKLLSATNLFKPLDLQIKKAKAVRDQELGPAADA